VSAIDSAAEQSRAARAERFAAAAVAQRYDRLVPMGAEDRRQRMFSLIERLWYFVVTDEDSLWANDDMEELLRLINDNDDNPLGTYHVPHDAFVFLGLDARKAARYTEEDLQRAYQAAMQAIRVPEAIGHDARTLVMEAMCRLVLVGHTVLMPRMRSFLVRQVEERLAPLRDVTERIQDAAYAEYCREIRGGGRVPDVERYVAAAQQELFASIGPVMSNGPATGPVFGLGSAGAGRAWAGEARSGRGGRGGPSRGGGTGGRPRWRGWNGSG